MTLSNNPRALKFATLRQSCDDPGSALEKNLAVKGAPTTDRVRLATTPPEWHASTIVSNLSTILLTGEMCSANSAWVIVWPS